jgi:hypothetical protein
MSVIIVVLVLLTGLYFFKRMEHMFADVVWMKDSDLTISIRGLGKQYRIGQLAKTTFTLEDWFVDTCNRKETG